ncbi:MAG: hypothetical protein KVP17_003859 [Porospora cf. gigantea B]|uniref:uncharacterized protein n=1 Tax=Porospora cf. gigantea B TaxID=2853592 RepID=UPI003571D5B5|nr:MAG: hypothetical protein KVP17_003859 [Porospora cf. gigantea B]
MSMDELDEVVARVKRAHIQYSSFPQNKVDAIFKAAAMAANAERIQLAKEAVAETGMGLLEDKVIKNHFAAEIFYDHYKDMKTCDVIDEDPVFGTMQLAEPAGVVAAVVPTTNPTSTAIFKALCAIKTRCGIVFSPHPRAKACTIHAAKVVLEAAVEAGAPNDLIGWLEVPTVELSNALMKHPDIDIILATGGPGMVKAAYASGKPALGVGAGNVPVLVDETANLKRAVASVIMSKTFDYGVVCASEQAIIVVDKVYAQTLSELRRSKAHILSPEDKKLVGDLIFAKGVLNAEVVGKPAAYIANLAGVHVPEDTKILVGEGECVDASDWWAHEKLSPTLGMFRAADFDDAVTQCETMLEIGGKGHTSCLFTDQDRNHDRIEEFSRRMKTCRILLNQPTSMGGIGGLYNFKLKPSMTLGCGTWGGNSTSENVGPQHLINVKTVALRAENMLWTKLPPAVYFKRGCLPVALKDLVGKTRALIVTDTFLFTHGYVEPVVRYCKEYGMQVDVFHEVPPDPTLEVCRRGAARMLAYQPDVILAVGGGSPMDAAKFMWVLYEHPTADFHDMALRFLDIVRRVYKFPPMGKKAMLVCISTTSGTGAEVTPFAVVTDDEGIKYPLADYALTPHMAIVDANFTLNKPRSLTAYCGYDAITHAVEAHVSVMASEYTEGYVFSAMKLLKEWLPAAYNEGSANPLAREKVHNGSCLAAMAFSNAFLGICHSMAHKIGPAFHIPHGLANALLICNVVRFNATATPTKQTALSQYSHSVSRERYAELAVRLSLTQPDDDVDSQVCRFVDWLEELKVVLNIPKSIQALGVAEDAFVAKVDELALNAFDDQCTGANPRYPLISELKQLLLDSYYGKAYRDPQYN